ncbi:MAG TPA: hypothetical protein VLI04_04770 [Nocardioidaceae bacterium]|nr:hypothetical protein [Nocardioidaceae bacterium]
MRTPGQKRALAGALVTPLLLLGVTACSGDEEPTAGDPTSTETTDVTPTGGETDTLAGEPVSDPEAIFDDMVTAMREAGTVQVATDLGVGTANGAMSYAGDKTEMVLTLDIGPMAGMEMRFVDDELYMSWPPSITPVGKFFRLSDTSSMADLADSLRSSSPVDSAADIAEAVESMTEVGEELIGNEPTTHYIVRLDTSQAGNFLGQGEVPDEAQVELPDTLDIDMWVTEEGLMRRVVMALGATAAQLDYTDWGAPVDIEAPAAEDIVATPQGF